MQLAVRLSQRDGVRPALDRLRSGARPDRDGSNGASPAAVTIQRAAGAFAADQRMPASTPASGPTNPSMVSGTTGSAEGRKARGIAVGIDDHGADLGRSRQTTWLQHGLAGELEQPLVAAAHAPRRPPARTTPVTSNRPLISRPRRPCRRCGADSALDHEVIVEGDAPSRPSRRFPRRSIDSGQLVLSDESSRMHLHHAQRNCGASAMSCSSAYSCLRRPLQLCALHSSIPSARNRSITPALPHGCPCGRACCPRPPPGRDRRRRRCARAPAAPRSACRARGRSA